MSKRISDEERVVAFFQTSDESTGALLLLVIRGILRSRFPQKPKRRSASKPRKVADAFWKDDVSRQPAIVPPAIVAKAS